MDSQPGEKDPPNPKACPAMMPQQHFHVSSQQTELWQTGAAKHLEEDNPC